MHVNKYKEKSVPSFVKHLKRFKFDSGFTTHTWIAIFYTVILLSHFKRVSGFNTVLILSE